MAVGLSAVNFSNKVLDHMLRAGASTAPPSNNVKLHTNVGEPGAAGTANASSVTTRAVATFGNPAATGSCAITNTPSWPAWAGASETLGYISVWDNISAGVFLYSAALATPKAITGGDTFTLSSLSVSLGPLAT